MSDRILHCWTGKREHLEESGLTHSDEWFSTWTDDGDDNDSTCMLEAGHEGPHVWTDNQIEVTFGQLPSVEGAHA